MKFTDDYCVIVFKISGDHTPYLYGEYIFESEKEAVEVLDNSIKPSGLPYCGYEYSIMTLRDFINIFRFRQ